MSRYERAVVLSLILLLVAIVPASSQSPSPATAPADLDAYVTRVLDAFEVPGLALAVVKDGRVLVAKGYGVRALGQPAPVDARTLFGIASNTKVFTATALGLLEEEGKIEWDAPVRRYLPWFALSDPYVTRELTVRDLLVHRSGLGLGAGDLLWWPPSTYDRDEIARRLRFIPLATSFRSAYAYDNVLYLVAGEVIEAVSGETWEDFVSTRILQRVGMRDSNVLHSAAASGGNAATPHASIDGRVRAIEPFASDNTNPAGGINSNARDMARWMNVLIARGRLADGTPLISEATWRQITTPVTPIPIDPDPAPELAALQPQFNGYALGLRVRDYRGQKVLQHTGGLPGFVSQVTTIPDTGLGIAVLTNQESREAYNAITWRLIDHFLGAPATDWTEAWLKVRARERAETARAMEKAEAERDAASKPSLPLEKYSGTYSDPWYGDVTLTLEAGKLVMRFTRTPSLVGDLEHWQHDTFVVRWRDRELRADAFVTFALDPDATIREARMEAVSPTTDFSFDFQDLSLTPTTR